MTIRFSIDYCYIRADIRLFRGFNCRENRLRKAPQKHPCIPAIKPGKQGSWHPIYLTDMFVDFFGNLVFWKGSKHLVYNLAVFKHKKRRNASDTIL